MGNPDVEKIVGDETSQRRPDARLVAGNDCRVGDRNTQRMSKQRDDREPVCACADHAGFGEGADIREPRPTRLGGGRKHIERDHQDEQERCDCAHTPQAAAALVTFLDVRKRGAGGHLQSRFLRQDVAWRLRTISLRYIFVRTAYLVVGLEAKPAALRYVIKRAHLKHILGVLFQAQWKIDASLTFKNPVKW